MEKLFFRLLAVLLSTVLNSALAQNTQSYWEVGGTLVLTPLASGSVSNILWKHKANLAAEWLNNELDYYGIFRANTTLDTTTGQLKIQNINESYAGLYTVEINNKVQSKGYDVEVIRRLSKPEVLQRPLSCSTASDSCTLSCGNGDTSGAGPVDYSWKEDDGEWVLEGKDKTIMNNVETQRIKTFSCRVKNPVSVEDSDVHQNPFFQEEPPSPVGPVVGGVLVFLALVGGSVGVYLKRESIRKLLTGGSNAAASSHQNGNAQDPPPPEGQPLTSTESKDPAPSES